MNAFRGAFQFDDATILSDPRLMNWPVLASHVFQMIRPLLKFTFLIDRTLWGEHAALYHAINLLLHLGSGLFVFGILRRLSDERIAFWTAALFLIHPITTETVTYISGRATGLMAFFYLAGIYCYLRSARAAAVGCFVLSLLSKETAVTFPAALLLIENVGRGRRGIDLRRVVVGSQLPFWGIPLAFLASVAAHPRYSYLARASFEIRPWYENLLTQINAVAYALTLFALPGRLAFDHDLPIARSIFAWPTPLALLVLAGLIAIAVALLRPHTLVAFGVSWFFLQLLPTNSVLPRYDVLSERNLYLAAPGISLALIAAWSVLAESVKPARLLPFALVPLLAVATIARNTVYATPLAFWADAARKSPAKARPHANLGYAYYMEGDFDRAILEFRAALAIDRDDPIAQANLLATWRRKR